MVHKIYVHELQCYKAASEEARSGKLVSPNRCFDLQKLPTRGLREEVGKYIRHRGEVLSLSSIRSEFWPYNVLCKFLAEKYPALNSFSDESLERMTKRLKAWLLNNGYRILERKNTCQTNAYFLDH